MAPILLTVKEACARLGIKNEQGLRELLKAGVPFGKAVKLKKWKYWIFAERLEAYLRGECNENSTMA